MTERIAVEVGGRALRLSNLDKPLYPADDGFAGFTKSQVIDYYARIAPVLLPHIAGRPMTVKRYPDGTGTGSAGAFFEKNAPRHAPDWIRTQVLPSPGSTSGREHVRYLVVDELPTLVWLANLAALELHVPQWRLGPRGAPAGADLCVFDLDPGPPATILECRQVAGELRAALAADGLDCYAKTSGGKGLHLYAPVAAGASGATAAYAKALAIRLAGAHPDLIVSDMSRRLRRGRVLIDWSQNNPAKTTVAPYSLRGRRYPTVSTPVSWAELDAAIGPDDLGFGPDAVLDRVARDGDLLAGLLTGDRREPPS